MKTIKLTPEKYNKEVIVDDDDYEIYSKNSWNYGGSYARRKRNGKLIYMHRLIVSAPKHLEVDHIDGNMLNNRKENLRIVTSSQNKMNKIYKVGVSGFRGVVFNKRSNNYMAIIKQFGRRKYLGSFDTAKEASIHFESIALKFRGEFATVSIK